MSARISTIAWQLARRLQERETDVSVSGAAALDGAPKTFLDTPKGHSSALLATLVGQYLWDSHHREFAGGTQVERSGYVQLRYAW